MCLFEQLKPKPRMLMLLLCFLLLPVLLMGERVVLSEPRAAATTEPPVNQDGDVFPAFAVGVFLMESGETHRALEHFQIAWEQSDHHPSVGMKLAEAFYFLKRFSSSETIIDEVLEKDQLNFGALLIKAKIRYLQNDPENALKYLERIVSLHGDSFEILRLLGNIYYEMGKSQEALAIYEKALNLYPNSARMQHRYGLLLAKTGRFEDAEAAFQKAISIDPRFTESAGELARIFIENGRVGEAESVLETAVQNGFRTENIMLILGTLYMEIGKLDDGIQLLESQRQQTELSPEAQILLGRLYFEAKEFEEAARIFKTRLAADPNNPDIARLLADIYLLIGDPDLALHYFRMAIDLDPDDYRRYLGLFFASSPRFAQQDASRIELPDRQGVEVLDQAGALVKPDDFNGNYLIGISYLSIDSLDTAEDYLTQALKLEPKDEGTLLNLANISERRNQYQQAENYLEILIQQKPDDPTICNFYGYLLSEMGKDLHRAEELIRKALAQDPSNGYYIDSLGWIYYQRGEYDLAVIELEKASRLVKGDPVILEHLGDVYRALNRLQDALTAYRESEAIDGENTDILRKIETTEKGLQ
jgi:tetratricopeptide (TPR) repeat protein